MDRDPLAERVSALSYKLDQRDREIAQLRIKVKEAGKIPPLPAGKKSLPARGEVKRRGKLDARSASHATVQGILAAPAQGLVDFVSRILLAGGLYGWHSLFTDPFIIDYIAAPFAMASVTLIYQLFRKF